MDFKTTYVFVTMSTKDITIADVLTENNKILLTLCNKLRMYHYPTRLILL